MSEELYATLTAEQTLNATIAIAKGDKGDKGAKGDAYIITESDKQEIKEALSGDIRELKSDLVKLKNGIDTLNGKFEIGVLDRTTIYPNLKYMVSNKTIQYYDRDVKFSIKNGYYLNINYYNESAERIQAWSNRTGSFTVPKHTWFNLSVTRNPLDTSEVITNVTEFTDAISFNTIIENRLEYLEDNLETMVNALNDVKLAYSFSRIGLEYGNIENGTGIIKDGPYLRTSSYIKANKNDVLSFSYTRYDGNKVSVNFNAYEYDKNGVLVGGAIAGWKTTYTVTKDCNLLLVFNNNLNDISSVSRRVSPFEFATVVSISYAPSKFLIDGKSIDIRNNEIITKMNHTYYSNVVKTIAHRGDFLFAPQNTKPSYIEARKRGITIAENDVFISSDGVYVMWHDPSLSRLGELVDVNGYLMYTDGTTYYWYDNTNNKLYTYVDDYIESSVVLSTLTRCNGSNYSVNTLPYSVLNRIDFGTWKNERFRGTHILTFEEWILLCKQLGMEVYIDTKLQYTETDLIALVSTVKKLGMIKNATWLNIPYELTSKLKELDSNVRIGLLENPTQSLIDAYSMYNTNRGIFFNGSADRITKEMVELGLSNGFEVESYYVEFGDRTPEYVYEKIRTLVSYGVTGITTDHYRVDEAFEYLYT